MPTSRITGVSPDGLEAIAQIGTQLGRNGLGILALLGDESDVDTQADGQDHAGHHTGHEQRAHRGAGEHGVDHGGDGGGEDGADGGGGGGDGAGEAVVIALGAHGVDLHLAQAGGVGHGGAGHAGEHQRGQHVHVGQTAGEAAHQALAHAEHILVDLAGVHHVGGKDKQGHGDDGGVGEDGLDGLLGHQMQLALLAGDHADKAVSVHQAVGEEVHGTGGDHARGDGHPQHEHQDEADEEYDQRKVTTGVSLSCKKAAVAAMTASVDRETVPAAFPGHKGPKVLKSLKVSKAAKNAESPRGTKKSPRGTKNFSKKRRAMMFGVCGVPFDIQKAFFSLNIVCIRKKIVNFGVCNAHEHGTHDLLTTTSSGTQAKSASQKPITVIYGKV